MFILPVFFISTKHFLTSFTLLSNSLWSLTYFTFSLECCLVLLSCFHIIPSLLSHPPLIFHIFTFTSSVILTLSPVAPPSLCLSSVRQPHHVLLLLSLIFLCFSSRFLSPQMCHSNPRRQNTEGKLACVSVRTRACVSISILLLFIQVISKEITEKKRFDKWDIHLFSST